MNDSLREQQAPVNRLPVELLTEIIETIAHDPDYDNWRNYLPDESISISHVCKLWREVALGSGCKALWTRAPLQHTAACVHAFMERSQPLPVSLTILLGVDDMNTSITALAEAATYMERVEEISFRSLSLQGGGYSLSSADEQLHNRVYEILSLKPAPSLKCLTWFFACESGEPPDYLPSTMFAGHVPHALRTFRVVNMAMLPRDAILRAPLTSLELVGCMAWENTDELLGTLSCMPNLERFVFGSWLYVVFNDDRLPRAYSKRSINLPHLRTLCLPRYETPLRVSAMIFAHLRIPINARIHWQGIFDDDTRQEDVTMACEALASHYHHGYLPNGLRFLFSSISIGFSGVSTGNLVLQASCGNAPCLSLDLASIADWLYPSRAMIQTIAHAFLGLPVTAHATQLHVSYSEYSSGGHVSDWMPLRARIPDLKTIRISRTAFQGFFPALLAPAEPHIIFPNLSRLLFEALAFDEEGVLAALFILALTRIVQHRAAHGHPLRLIEFRRCFGAAILVEQLSVALPEMVIVHKNSFHSKDHLRRNQAWRDSIGGDADIHTLDDE